MNGPALHADSPLSRGRRLRAGAVDKTVDSMTRDVASQGYAFSEVRPHGERDTKNHTIALELFGRQRSEGLHRTHRHHRQHPHPRLRHSPRVRYRRRRPLQPRHGRARGTADQRPRVLQEGPHLESSGFVARSRHHRRRRRGPADRLDQPQRRLFDDPRDHGRVGLHRDQLPRPRPVRPPERVRRPVQPGLEGVVHRTLFPRPAPGGGLRPVSPGQQPEPVRAL